MLVCASDGLCQANERIEVFCEAVHEKEYSTCVIAVHQIRTSWLGRQGREVPATLADEYALAHVVRVG